MAESLKNQTTDVVSNMVAPKKDDEGGLSNMMKGANSFLDHVTHPLGDLKQMSDQAVVDAVIDLYVEPAFEKRFGRVCIHTNTNALFFLFACFIICDA
jgi:hypothetical protein